MSILESTKISDDLIRSYWHPVAHTSELANDRDFIRFDIKDFEVLVINDKGNRSEERRVGKECPV